MKKPRYGPLVPLYLAYSPELLLLARCLWYREDALRAAMLVESLKLPLLAQPLFELLTSPCCPRSGNDTELLEIREWVRSKDPRLVPLVMRLIEIPLECIDLAVLSECVQMIEHGRVWVDDPRYKRPRWQRDLEKNVLVLDSA